MMILRLHSVIVGDFDLVGIVPAPCETDSMLIVDPDAVLALAVAAKLL
jgi:hypothetical protein